MEVLLRREVDKLGQAGDLVRVADGYAQNFLLPQGLAVTVSKANRQMVEVERKRLVQQEEARVSDLREIAKKLAGTSVTITERTSSEGHLYGSVGPQQIAEALRKHGFEIEPKMVILEEPIKETNVYEVPVRLHPDIEVPCKIWVVSDSEPEAKQKPEPEAEAEAEPHPEHEDSTDPDADQ